MRGNNNDPRMLSDASTSPPCRRRLLYGILYLAAFCLIYLCSLSLAHGRYALPQAYTREPRQSSVPRPHEPDRTKEAPDPDPDITITPVADRTRTWTTPVATTVTAPGIAWLMSFGGSGTSYTITTVEAATGTTTATNYAEGFDVCVGVASQDAPPCLHKERLPRPATSILTKTHCGGYCMDCPPEAYIHTTDSFATACRTGKLTVDGHLEVSVYNTTLVHKAVHLLRNPLDNLVGRMHLGTKRRQRQGRGPTEDFTDTPEGLAAWCAQLDARALVRETRSPLVADDFVARFGHVPCHAEWFRLAQWHTRARQVTDRLQISVHYLYYETYTDPQTLPELLEFLDLTATQAPLPFRAGKSYRHLWKAADVAEAARLVQAVASDEAWALLRHYFESEMVALDEGSPVVALDETSLPVPDSTTPSFPAIAWLMSFPNSGTSYTISNTEHVSQRTTASNYGVGLFYIDPQMADGPYLHRPTMESPSHVLLTKTHCMGYCDDCRPRGFMISSPDDFLRGCATGHRLVNETTTERVSTTYEASVVTRAVHLFRDPFDNLVARMHLAVKRRRDDLGWTEEQLGKFAHSREGHLAWCAFVDQKHGPALRSVMTDDKVKALMDDQLPCFVDWYRWISWHNRAEELTRTRPLPVHYLYYEDYSSDYNATLGNLLDFLQLPTVQAPLTFHTGKTYRDLYVDSERRRATRLIQALASAETWTLVQHYFDDL